MCEPTTMMILSAATAAAGVAKDKQNQKLQIQATENQAEAAVTEYNYSQKNIENKATADKDVAENALFNQNLEAIEARSSALAQSGSQGVTGNTVNASDQSLNAAIGRKENEINRNFDINQQSSQSASDSNYRSLQSALTGMSGDVAGPGILDSALKIGGAAYGGYNSVKSQTSKIDDEYIK